MRGSILHTGGMTNYNSVKANGSLLQKRVYQIKDSIWIVNHNIIILYLSGEGLPGEGCIQLEVHSASGEHQVC